MIQLSIVVVGSINTDLITMSNNFPKIGETITGDDFVTLPGGKGANQAVCAAKLGEDVKFIGCVGNDTNGKFSTKNLEKYKVDISGVEIVEDVPSGIAQITVAERDNTIIIVPGANGKVTKEVVDKHISILESADIVLLQLEIPIETVEYIVDLCNKRNIKVILNPAPAVKLSIDLIEKVDYFTPNETELELIFNSSRDEVLSKYPNKILMTSGSEGVYYHNGKEIINVPAIKVDVKDTTGAGDTVNGALAYALVNGYELKEAIIFANKVASKTVQKVGAQTAMPYLNDIE